MSLPLVIFVAHLAALVFGLIGMLVMIPNPWLWAGSPALVPVFGWSMQYAGALHIVLGAAAMLAFGLRFLGPRRTLIFFVASTTLSLSFELLGTGTGWPFGAYAYTQGLGYKIGGRVPYTIPLSWFYMGFASYLLANAIVSAYGGRPRAPWSVLLGAWFLMVWDLVLDPAMAHASLPIQFWVWHQTGPYFGMPLQNFAGWLGTGLAFMALSRLLWRRDLRADEAPARFALLVYAANLLFAMVLSGSVGLWGPILGAVLLGLLPAALAVAGPVSSARLRPSVSG
jgi:carotene biosynthesis associated membrane protein